MIAAGESDGVRHPLEDLVRAHAEEGQITGVIREEARPAAFAPWPQWTDPRLIAYCEAAGVPQLWTHQVEAAESIARGQHTVIATGTGSGKSLAAWLPFFSLSAPPPSQPGSSLTIGRPTALYLSPTKALAADQAEEVERMARAVDPHIGVAAVDGDADGSVRAWARQHASVILSNPDFAHYSLLAGHERWARLWRNLSLVVVDEFHHYRGVFGAHVAHIVRRIMRIAASYGAHPTVVFLSATCAHPGESASRFLGEALGPIYSVESDGSPRGPHTIILWQGRRAHITGDAETTPMDKGAPAASPNAAAAESDAPRRAANTEAGELMGLLASAGARSLTFVRSRPGTESVASIAREWLREHKPEVTNRVAAYRGGYLPEERRELEARLRTGDLLALASTNALELGIDISGLDAVVVTGWPGTHASFAQQVGRAGRAGYPGLAIFVGRENPLDQYLLENPEVVTDSASEASVCDPSNPTVLIPQLCAAAAELPLTSRDAAVFDLPDTSLFTDLEASGLLRRRPTGWFWNTTVGLSAHDIVDLRGSSHTVSIVNSDSGSVLGTVDGSRADTSVYPGAIYLHQGVLYMVDELGDDVALVHIHTDEGLRTYARTESDMRIERESERRSYSYSTWSHGMVSLHSRVVGYDVRRTEDGMYLGMVPLAMPLHELTTAAVWCTVTREALVDAGLDASEIPGALHGAEHAMIGMLPLFAMCDRNDLGGLSTSVHPDTGQPTIVVHDALSGGSGCSARGFDAAVEWIRATAQAIAACPCIHGCPRCVQSPKCGNNNEPLSKAGALILLNLILHDWAGPRR